jgi:hypothetical protein
MFDKALVPNSHTKMSEIQKIVDAIGRLKANKWWIHEDAMQDGKYLTNGRHGCLTMADLGPGLPEKSYIGHKKDGIKTGRPTLDLYSRESNELNIYGLEHGQGKSFLVVRLLICIREKVMS